MGFWMNMRHHWLYEERSYYDEEGNLDIDVEAIGYEFGMDLAFGVLSVYEGKPERVLKFRNM